MKRFRRNFLSKLDYVRWSNRNMQQQRDSRSSLLRCKSYA